MNSIGSAEAPGRQRHAAAGLPLRGWLCRVVRSRPERPRPAIRRFVRGRRTGTPVCGTVFLRIPGRRCSELSSADAGPVSAPAPRCVRRQLQRLPASGPSACASRLRRELPKSAQFQVEIDTGAICFPRQLFAAWFAMCRQDAWRCTGTPCGEVVFLALAAKRRSSPARRGEARHVPLGRHGAADGVPSHGWGSGAVRRCRPSTLRMCSDGYSALARSAWRCVGVVLRRRKDCRRPVRAPKSTCVSHGR